MCAMLSLFTEFTKEFERTRTIILQQLFTSGLGVYSTKKLIDFVLRLFSIDFHFAFSE